VTPWYVALLILGLVAFAVALWKGGRIERQAVAVLSVNYVLTIGIDRLKVPHDVALVAGLDGVTALVFLWLALRYQRWWLLAATAGLVLCTLTWVIGLLHPGIGFVAVASAEIGEWAFVYLTLLAGVCERWLAGETPVRLRLRPQRKTT
jgi:hypothetical protein